MPFTIYCIFLVFAIGGRAFLQYKLTGDHGIRPTNLDSSNKVKVSSGLLMLAFIVTFVLTTLDAFEFTDQALIKHAAIHFLGILVAAVGIILTILSQWNMGKDWRIGVDENEETELVTTGLFAYSRNPIYAGVIIFGIGLWLLVPSEAMMFFLGLGFFSIELHVRQVEEPHLLNLHGEPYQQYMQATGRYLPCFKR